MKVLKGGLLATVAAGALVAALTSSVSAQEAVNPDQGVAQRTAEGYEPVGATVGSFRLLPKVEVVEEFNDNIFKEENDETDDMITKVQPTLNLRSDWNNHALNLGAGADFGFYADSNDDDYEDYNAKVDGRIDASQALTFNGLGSFEHLHEDRGGDDVDADAADPVEYDRLKAEFGGRFKPNRISLGATGRVTDLDYDDNAELDGGTTNNDDRDRQVLEGELRAGYEIQTGYEAFVKGVLNDRDYDSDVDDNGFNRDSDGYNIQTGIAIDLDRLIRADLGVGWMEQDYTDPSLRDADGYSADATVRWNLTELTTVRGTFARAINETTTDDASAIIATSYGLGVDHEFLRNLVATADANYQNSDYEGISREDDLMSFRLGLDYKLNRNFFAGVSYKFEDRDSNVTDQSYDNNIFAIKIGAQF